MTSTLQQLKQHLAQAQHNPDVVLLLEHSTSTNDELIQLVQRSPSIQSALICSEQQTQGRGQQKRTWHSPKGNIYFSCLAQLQRPLDGRFSLEVALNILNCPTLYHAPLQVKWANDLYSHAGKWGGILIEPISPSCAVVGIGINLYALDDSYRSQIEQAYTSLSELNIAFERTQLIAELYLAVQNAVQWFEFGSKNLVQRFQHHAYGYQQMVQFSHPTGECTGSYLGVNEHGALALAQADGVHYFYQGRMRLME
ncbi:MAG: biotin--[acetyl-CoA-carboxylase] ligase [Acinetobacter sp.]|nr:biotin--[acetyl-CoA-carboxylase] ligase [Acinetobacter sp.]